MATLATTLLYRWFNEVWNQGNETVIDQLFAENGIAHGIAPGENLQGPDGFKAFYHQFHDQFRDINIEVSEVVSEENFESARCVVHATSKELNKPVRFNGICMARIENGKIAEAWNNFDFLEMNQQLGLKLVPDDTLQTQ